MFALCALWVDSPLPLFRPAAVFRSPSGVRSLIRGVIADSSRGGLGIPATAADNYREDCRLPELLCRSVSGVVAGLEEQWRESEGDERPGHPAALLE
jgi:hypothetical protein